MNSINPFSEEKIKNELLVYSDSKLVAPISKNERLSTEEGRTYDAATKREVVLSLADYSTIHIDFNGSMAFFGELWEQRLRDPMVANKIRGAFVMGGVRAEEAPGTMPAIPGVLNRFSSATMNQLYHPPHTAAFFGFLAASGVPTYVVTNNAVGPFGRASTSAEDKSPVISAVDEFLAANEIAVRETFLHKLAMAHYTSRYNPPLKAFDFYVAVALRAHMAGGADALSGAAEPGKLFYSGSYGISLVSKSTSWDTARWLYAAHMRPLMMESELSKDQRIKRDLFKEELDIMLQLNRLPDLDIFDLHFLEDEAQRHRVALRH